MVEAALLSEVVAFPLAEAELQRLEATQAKLARRALRGKGCLKVEATDIRAKHHAALPNTRVREMLRLRTP
eukprot:1150047-Pyramimonas_sp.AAC.1